MFPFISLQNLTRPLACLLLMVGAAACDDEPATLQPAAALTSNGSPPLSAAYARTDIGGVVGASRPAIAGEKLNADLLKKFYTRHNFEPVWASHPAQAKALTEMVLNAHDQGLSPELFHGDLLRAPQRLSPVDREIVLSDAFLRYADALARGAVPIEQRRDDEVLSPEPVDIAAVLDAAIASPDPAKAVDELAPTTPSYRVLRQALRNGTAPGHERELEVNMERQRWLPRRLPPDRVWVNIADARLVMVRGNRDVFSTRVIVGQEDRPNQSPEFQATIERVLFNPPWVIPNDIAKNEYLPIAAKDPTYLAKHNMVLRPDGVLEQKAGPGAGLGQFLFELPNKFDVYLHDTPGKQLFGRDGRRLSHGCIRVDGADQLAALLMDQPIGSIHQTIAPGDTIRSPVPKPIPVIVVYETAFAEFDGRLEFRADVYGRDPEIWQALHRYRN